ncbi:MAG: hypothetical protein A2340_03755 [Lentisphaerae bacterium RIFOXYB12_FULL_60_10]|nr:MAG: hypothetical protein A2340_03755 [Lentisphaerae bacterium RIFOXYB12_FULL_60_10]
MIRTVPKHILHGDTASSSACGLRYTSADRRSGVTAGTANPGYSEWILRQWKRQATHAGKFVGR